MSKSGNCEGRGGEEREREGRGGEEREGRGGEGKNGLYVVTCELASFSGYSPVTISGEDLGTMLA